MTALTRPQKITLADMREMGVRGNLIYCSDYHCSHSIAISAEQWPDHVRLSDLEALFRCEACGKKGADVWAELRLVKGENQKARGSTGRANGGLI